MQENKIKFRKSKTKLQWEMKNWIVLDQAHTAIFCAARTKEIIINFDCSLS